MDLAIQNADLNDFSDRCRFFQGDIQNEKTIEDNMFHSIVMNPPYMEGGTPSPENNKATAHHENSSGATLEDWVKYAHKKLKQGGALTMVHRADRLDDIIITLEKKRWFGSLEIFPLWPHAGENAKRVIIRARKERYAPLVLKVGMVIHREDGKYTKEADRILSDAGTLD